VQDREQNRLDSVKRQLSEAVVRSADAQNAAEDSEATWRSTISLLEACQQNADTADAYAHATERFIHSATECRHAASAALFTHSHHHRARKEAQSATCAAQDITKLLNAPEYEVTTLSRPYHAPCEQSSALVAKQSITSGPSTRSEQALENAQARVKHAEYSLGRLKSSLSCRQGTLQALRQVVADREQHHHFAQELLRIGSDVRATRRQLKSVANHATEVCISPCLLH
jgi:hypothetical protein